MFVLQHFPQIGSLAIIDPIERLHSNALHFAQHWKELALQSAVHVGDAPNKGGGAGSVNGNETEPLLLTEPTEVGLQEEAAALDSDDEEEPEEENPRDHFWKNLIIAIIQMVGGTGVVFIFSDPMVDVRNMFFCIPPCLFNFF